MYAHGNVLRLDSDLLLYPFLLYDCEEAVKAAAVQSPSGMSFASKIAEGEQGDAIEIVYDVPRQFMAGSPAFVVDHMFITLTQVPKASVALFMGQGGYQSGLSISSASVGPKLREVAAQIAAIQARRNQAAKP